MELRNPDLRELHLSHNLFTARGAVASSGAAKSERKEVSADDSDNSLTGELGRHGKWKHFMRFDQTTGHSEDLSRRSPPCSALFLNGVLASGVC